MPDRLVWPPRKEDLERMYLGERLSAMKIAEAYGLRYASPKTAESTVLYHLRRNGIPRRDPAEHVRKVTPEMVDEWAKRYEAGESLKQIAAGSVDAVTVWSHLRRRGMVLRDRVEAQITAVSKHEKRPFCGSEIDRAYLIGMRLGDLYLTRHGRAVRVKLSTTHPAMAELFRRLFEPSGHVQSYPRSMKVAGFEWSLQVDLDASYEFLVAGTCPDNLRELPAPQFFGFLAGFFDAEGSILFHWKSNGYSPELSITNMDTMLMESIRCRLEEEGLHPRLAHIRQREGRLPGARECSIWRILVWRHDEVQGLLMRLELRHPEKIAKKQLALGLVIPRTSDSNRAIWADWDSLRDRIRRSRDDFVNLARTELEKRERREDAEA